MEMTELNADNLITKTTEEGQIVLEPQYVKYLREHDFTIDGIEEAHTVASSSTDGSHLVLKINTYDYPKDSEKLDVIADKRSIYVCDCWAYRQNSNDVSKGLIKPDGECGHTKEVSKVQKAKDDPKQTEVFGER